MKGQEVHKLTDDEIGVEIKRLRNELYTLRTQAVTEKVEDVSRFKKTRRDIARLLTERNARGAKAGAGAGGDAGTKSAKPAKTSKTTTKKTRTRETAKA